MQHNIISSAEQSDMRAMARDLAASGLVPDDFRDKPANVALALQFAAKMDLPALSVMRGMYVTRGKVGWYSEFMVALLNRSGKLNGPLNYVEEGEGDLYRVRCTGVDASSREQREGQWITWSHIRANGWDRNAQYKTNTATMFRRRAAAAFVRDYYPDVLLGLPTQEELRDTVLVEEAERAEAIADGCSAYNAMTRRQADLAEPVDVDVAVDAETSTDERWTLGGAQ